MKRFHVHRHVEEFDQNIAREHFRTPGDIPVFNEAAFPEGAAAECRTPPLRGKPIAIPVKSQSSCG